jgi:hypothetical protein
MLWTKYPKSLDNTTLNEAYRSLEGDPPGEIPLMVWLLENPDSPCALPGNIDLFGHDCLHLLLKKGFTNDSEAYVVGFTMGNDERTTWLHLRLFKLFALHLYPDKYRLTPTEIERFDRGFHVGKNAKIKNINQMDLKEWSEKSLREIRSEIDLELSGDLSGMLN